MGGGDGVGDALIREEREVDGGESECEGAGGGGGDCASTALSTGEP